jgi:hypothetical protein
VSRPVPEELQAPLLAGRFELQLPDKTVESRSMFGLLLGEGAKVVDHIPAVGGR